MKLSSHNKKSLSLEKEKFKNDHMQSSSLHKKTAIQFNEIIDHAIPERYGSRKEMKITVDKKIMIKVKNREEIKSKEKDEKRKLKTSKTERVKLFIGNKLEKQLEKYFLFLNLLKCSIGCLATRNNETDQKFIVYVGKGNNSLLIQKIFKSRHWWTVTKNIKCEGINLIWTQKSRKFIFDQIDGGNVGNNFMGKIRSGRIICKGGVEKKNQVMNQFNSILGRQERDISKQTFISTESSVKSYIKNRKFDKRDEIMIQNTCNHIEGHELLTNKKNLYHNMKKYYEEKNENVFDVLPLTLHIENIEEQFDDALKIEQELMKIDKKLMWICKPGENTNRGNGIKVFKKMNEVKEFIEKESESHVNRTYIIQKYIYPALYHRRKYDIRCFILVISSPEISAYFYNEGYLRTSSKEFKDKKFDDEFMHLTNDAIQKKGCDYGKFEKGNKVTFGEYQKYLDLFEKEKEVSFRKMILPKLKEISARSIESCFKDFNKREKSYSFELLGYDFMLDEGYRPWLIEVNTNPCLETGCPVLDDIIPSVLENTLKIAVDSVFRPVRFNKWHLQDVITFPERILEKNQFELIFQENFDV